MENTGSIWSEQNGAQMLERSNGRVESRLSRGVASTGLDDSRLCAERAHGSISIWKNRESSCSIVCRELSSLRPLSSTQPIGMNHAPH